MQLRVENGDAQLRTRKGLDWTAKLIFFAFDLLFIEGDDLRELPLRDRKARLKALLAKSKLPPTLRYVDHFILLPARARVHAG